MELMRWQLETLPDSTDTSVPKNPGDENALLQALMAQRGFGAQPDKLPDPFSIADMQKACERLSKAIEAGETVLIFGDYDADGVCSTAILFSYLYNAGANVIFHIPDRDAGYGLNSQTVQKAANQGVTLIVTVDNGISCESEIKLANSLQMDVVIFDHHRVGEALPPALAVVDPHRLDDTSSESCKQLCGAGVVLFALAGLEGDWETALEMFSHLAAIATVADVMPLTGSNRLIVQHGLENLRFLDQPGLKLLMEQASVDPEKITAQDLAFRLAPRINASGRMGQASTALRLLLEEDCEEAAPLAAKLAEYVTARRREEERICEEIAMQIAQNPLLIHRQVCCFAGEGWHRGVIGIVAARMMEQLGKPCVVISLKDDMAVGSARSFAPYSVYEALCSAKALLEKYGGHSRAGGFSCKVGNLSALEQSLCDFADAAYGSLPAQTKRVDLQLQISQLTIPAVEKLNTLEPFGEGNPVPVFALCDVILLKVFPLSEGRFVRLFCKQEATTFSAVCFRYAEAELPFVPGDHLDFLVCVEIRQWNGSDNLSLRIEDMRPASLPFAAYEKGRLVFDSICRKEQITPALAEKCLPTREQLGKIYRLCKQLGSPTPEHIFFRLWTEKIGYAKICASLDMLCELGLVQKTPGAKGTCYPAAEPSGKADFTTSPLYRWIAARAAS